MSGIPTDNKTKGTTKVDGTDGQRLNDDILRVDIVIDPQRDIAVSTLLDRIIVGIAGRARLQKIYVHSGTGKGNLVIPYSPESNTPTTALSIHPTKEEVES